MYLYQSGSSPAAREHGVFMPVCSPIPIPASSPGTGSMGQRILLYRKTAGRKTCRQTATKSPGRTK